MTKFIILLCVLSFSWLQAVQSRYHRHHQGDIKRIAEKFRDLLSNDDPYFRGNLDSKYDQPEITEKDLPAIGETFEGDMVMDESLRKAVLGFGDKRSAVEGSTTGHAKHWPHGVVPFVFHESLKQPLRKQIWKAVENFRHYTCIRFREKTDQDKDYVIFTDGKGCSSSVGRQGGAQYIHLALGCKRIGTVQHEMMHALGIIHEQSRSDRDKFVKVRFDHIKKDLQNNFRKYDYGRTTNLDTPYNFYSVMHYSNDAFTVDGEPTLISKADHDLKFGQRTQWTCLDVKELNRLYECPATHCDRDFFMPDMTERDVIRRKRDQDRKDLYINEYESRF